MQWMCTPKGAAFLWVERSAQAGLVPLVTSHGYGLVSRKPGWIACIVLLSQQVGPGGLRQDSYLLLRHAMPAGSPFAASL